MFWKACWLLSPARRSHQFRCFPWGLGQEAVLRSAGERRPRRHLLLRQWNFRCKIIFLFYFYQHIICVVVVVILGSLQLARVQNKRSNPLSLIFGHIFGSDFPSFSYWHPLRYIFNKEFVPSEQIRLITCPPHPCLKDILFQPLLNYPLTTDTPGLENYNALTTNHVKTCLALSFVSKDKTESINRSQEGCWAASQMLACFLSRVQTKLVSPLRQHVAPLWTSLTYE